jgi:TRAP-type C4-dicarboxylate transport system substrate-binding protein
MKTRTHLCAASLLLLALSSRAETLEVKLATILPRGVGQDFLIRKLAEDWQKNSEGAVTLKIAPGGQKDGEAGIVKKLHSKNYQAALLSTVGLTEIEQDVSALQMMPLVFQNWDEVDFVREQIHGKLEEKLRAKGFVVLFWVDAGWVNFFSREKATTPAEFKKLPMFAWAGSTEQIALMKSLGYHPVALETDNIHSSFASGMIGSAPLPPVFAMGVQIPTVAPHVLEVNWCPIVGAAIVRADVWERIPTAVRAKLQPLCDKAALDIRAEGRRFHDEALATLRKGPKTQVHTPTPEERAQWAALAIELGPRVRGKLVPEQIFDEVQRLLKEYRAGKIAAK